MRLPWTLVRRSDLDELYATGRTAGLATAEQLVAALAEAVNRSDMHAVRLLYPTLMDTLTAERGRWQNEVVG